MAELVTVISEIMITMSIVIILVIFVSPYLKRKYSTRFIYFLWVAVAIRILIPINFNISHPVEVKSIYQEQKYPVYEMSGAYVIPQENGSEITIIPQDNSINPMLFIFGAWIIIGCSLIGYSFITYFNFLRKVKSLRFHDNQIQSYLNDIVIQEGYQQIEIYVVDELDSPMLVGLFHPMILIPNIELDDEALYMVLKHELIHYKRKDILAKWLLMLCRSIYWFNPLLWYMNKRACNDMEISCDEMLLNDTTIEYRKKYGEVMLSMIKRKSINNQSSLITEFSTRRSGLNERFNKLFDITNKKSDSKIFIISLLTILLSSTLVSCTVNSNLVLNKVPNRKIDIISVEDGVEYIFQIYTKEIKIKLLDNSPVSFDTPCVVQEDSKPYIKGDIVIPVLDSSSKEVVNEIVFPKSDVSNYENYTPIYSDYNQGITLLLKTTSTQINQQLKDSMIINDLTDKELLSKISVCVVLTDVNQEFADIRVYNSSIYPYTYTNISKTLESRGLTSYVFDDSEETMKIVFGDQKSHMKFMKMFSLDEPGTSYQSTVSAIYKNGHSIDEIKSMIVSQEYSLLGPFDILIDGVTINEIHINDDKSILPEEYLNYLDEVQ